ncbi:MAG: YebC/PmpR family DNA-binding transcriptional regulator [Sphingobacteriales bacterium]|nr:YebC/PmpR family DNA-binding transcriptional regulator [Sphingobacteriales bacterium]
MGRAFEYRKARKMARWGRMAVQFTRIGKEIAIAVKSAGANPDTNARLRLAMQNARACNMPKANVEGAIKRALSKDEKDYQEVVYEGYGPYGIAFVIETATDNPTRTVANLRTIFSKCGGALGNSGSVDYMFDRKAFFTIDPSGKNLEDLELELIDAGLEELAEEEGETYIQVAFNDFGAMQEALEKLGIPVISSEKERLPSTYKEITDEQRPDIEKLIDKLEDDEDVQAVFHNMKDNESE